MAIDFNEKSTLGEPWAIEVRGSGVLIGHIRKNPINGFYQFFKGPDNILNYDFEEPDLERLKARIRGTAS